VKGKLRHSHSTIQRQRLNWKVIALSFSILGIATLLSVVFINLSNPQEAYAVTCSSSYTVDWNDPATYTVNCGTLNSSSWTVKKDTCNYSSPVLLVGGTAGEPNKTVDLTVRINQSGNLTNNDFCWVDFYVNGSVSQSYYARGDTIANAVFYIPATLSVPAGGDYQVKVKFKNDRTNEFWEVKKGDIFSCVQSTAPLPVTLTSFKGKLTSDGTQFKWTTVAEVNNDYFTLSRSLDAENYVEVGRIPGNGTSSIEHNYSFTDSETPHGICYYMLSQTDYDGKTEKFGPIVIRKNNNSTNSYNGTAFPNPFKTHFTITFESLKDQPAHFSLIDLKGSVLDETILEVNSGINNFSFSPTKPLKSGLYLVRIENGNEQLVLCKVFKE